MTFELTLDLDNAAFDEPQTGAEIARILREVAVLVDGGRMAGPLRDVNGNTVGLCAMVRRDEPEPEPQAHPRIQRARMEAAERNARNFGTDPSWYGGKG